MSAGGLYTALSGAIAQSQALDAVANNVANASTQGFRAERVRFEEVLNEAASPQGRQVIATRGDQDPRAGNITQTNQPLDVALEGEGALQVVDGRGEVRDVRGGSFGRDAEGMLVDGEGRALLGDPLIALTWLANELSSLGIGLRTGDWASCGTCMVPLEIRPGDRVAADYGAFGRIEIGVSD